MHINPENLIDFNTNIFELNQNPVRIQKELVQNPMDFQDKTSSRSCTVKIGNTFLISTPQSKSEQQLKAEEDFFAEIEKFEQDKKEYYEICKSKEFLKDSKSEISKDAAIRIRGGKLGKSGPGARGKSAAKANASKTGSTVLPGAHGYVPHHNYCRYHGNRPFSCKPKVKVSKNPVVDDGNNNQPPEEGQFDASQYKGGPNPFLDKFDYNNPNHTRENVNYSCQKRLNHAYDGHAKKCFNMQENRNKETLKTFKGNVQDVIGSTNTVKYNGSYRYETPAYLYRDKGSNLVAVVNATDNSFITIVNATEYQLQNLQNNKNLGFDTRPSMQLTVTPKGPKGQN